MIDMIGKRSQSLYVDIIEIIVMLLKIIKEIIEIIEIKEVIERRSYMYIIER